MYAGRVAEEAPTAALLADARHPYSVGLVASRPRLAIAGGGSPRLFPAIPGAVPDLASRPRGCCAFVPRCPARFEPCDVREPALYPTDVGVARCFLYESHGDRPTGLHPSQSSDR
jgi:oligopeptide/dipeptide ABC transporter ATP-binding protein